MRYLCLWPVFAGVVLLSVLALAGCAGGGAPGPVVEDEAPETEDQAAEDFQDAWESRDIEAFRYAFDPVGPDPAGPDSLEIDWSEPSGPTVEGRPLDWADLQMQEFELDLGDDWDPFPDLISNLVIAGSVAGTTSGPPDGVWRVGAHYNAGFEDGSWFSVGLSGGEGMGGSPFGSGFDFGLDVHVRGNLAVHANGNRSAWLFGLRRGFYNWGGDNQVEYGLGYGGLAFDLPLGERTFLTVQGTLGVRWSEYPLEDLTLETGVDLGIVIPLSGPDKPQ